MTAAQVPHFQTRKTTIGGASAIALSGELDIETAPQLAEEVEMAVWGTVGAFVLDLSGLTFLDSSGLHALLRARAYLAREDRTLVLVCPRGPARRVLDLASVLDTFVVYPSSETAAAALARRRRWFAPRTRRTRPRRRATHIQPPPHPWRARLSGKAVAITGASSGIGEATALALARAGASVALGARRRDRIEALAQRIEDEAGATAVALEVDVADEAQARAFVAGATERLGRLDVLINNAGVMLLGPVESGDPDDWRRMVEVNLLGLLYCTHAALPIMREQGGGDIVNISSIAGRSARAGSAVYNLTKFGVNAFSEGLRQEVTEGGIRVIVVEPGLRRHRAAEPQQGRGARDDRGHARADRRRTGGQGHRQRHPLRGLAAAARVGQRSPDPPYRPGALSGA